MVEEVTTGVDAGRTRGAATGAGAGAARRVLLLVKKAPRGVDVRGVDVRAAVRATDAGMERMAYESFMWWPPALPTPYICTSGSVRRMEETVGVGLRCSESRR